MWKTNPAMWNSFHFRKFPALTPPLTTHFGKYAAKWESALCGATRRDVKITRPELRWKYAFSAERCHSKELLTHPFNKQRHRIFKPLLCKSWRTNKIWSTGIRLIQRRYAMMWNDMTVSGIVVAPELRCETADCVAAKLSLSPPNGGTPN